jgi:muconolactone delta-isomerase
MKFLVKCSVKDSLSMIPPAVGRQLMESTVDWMNQLKKKGSLLESWAIPGEATVAICEHPSAEDLSLTIVSMPLYGYMKFEVFPLSDINEFMKSEIEYLKAAEKMMSGKEMAGVR